MSFLKALRDAALVEPNVDKRYMLRGAADVLAGAINDLAFDPTTENMIEVNGAWSFAARCLASTTPTQDSTPGGALREGAKLAA